MIAKSGQPKYEHIFLLTNLMSFVALSFRLHQKHCFACRSKKTHQIAVEISAEALHPSFHHLNIVTL